MTDPLSVAASVLTVLSSGFSVAQGLYQLADGIGSAGTQVRVYADEIRLFSELLGVTRDELLKNSQQPRSRAEHLIMDILDVFERVLEPLKELQATLNPLSLRYRDSPTPLHNFALRVRWLFCSKDKLLWYRASLKVLNGLLNTTLTGMKTTTETNSTSNWYIQCNSLQMCIAGVRRSLTDPMQLQLGGLLQPTIQPISFLDGRSTALEGVPASPAVPPVEASTRLQITYPAELALQVSRMESEPDSREYETKVGDAIGDTVQSQELVPGPALQLQPSDNYADLGTGEIVEVQQNVAAKVDAQFDGSAQEIWEELRTVSRKVLRYAEDVLHGCSRAQSQDQPSTPGLQPDTPLEDPKEGSQYITIKTRHGELRVPSAQAGALAIRTHEDGFNVSHDVKDREPLLKAPTVSEAVTLKTFDGKIYPVPYASVQKWEDAKSLLLSLTYPQIIDSNDNNKEVTALELFEREDFELIGPQGQYVIPRFWAQTVQPNWTVELRLKDSVHFLGEAVDKPLLELPARSPAQSLDPSPTQSLKKPRERKLLRFGRVFKWR